MLAIRRIAAAVVAIGALSGCEKPPYDLAPVRGTVTLDGQPLSQGKVMFAPIARSADHNSGKPAFGPIQADGSYVLSTYKDKDGAIVGEHWITIFGPGKESAPVTHVSGSSAQSAKSTFSRIALPHKQSVIAGQDNRIDIKLSRQDVDRSSNAGN